MPIDSPEKYAQALKLAQSGRVSQATRKALMSQVSQYEALNPGTRSRLSGAAQLDESMAPAPLESATAGRPLTLAEQIEASRKGADSAASEAQPELPTEYRPHQSRSAIWGGDTRYYEEPPLAHVKAAVEAQGGDPDTITEESPEYRQYADALWEQKLGEAQKTKTPSVRLDKAPRNSIGDTLDYVAHKGLSLAQAAGMGFADAMVPAAGSGLYKEVLEAVDPGAAESAELARASHPVAATAGSILGALNPYSMGSQIAKGVGGILGLGSTASRLGGAVAGGAAAGAATAGVHEAEQAASTGELLTGQASENLGKSALLGGALGLVGGGIGEGARGINSMMRSSAVRGDAARQLRLAEDMGGGETDILRGFKISPKAREIAAAADSAQPLPITPIQEAANRVREPLAKAGVSRSGEVHSRLQAETENAQLALGGQKVSAAPLVQTVIQTLVKRTGDDAADLAFQNNEAMRKALPKLFGKPTLVAADAAGDVAASGGHTLSLKQAAGIGFDVKQLLAEGSQTGVVQPTTLARIGQQGRSLMIPEAGIVPSGGLPPFGGSVRANGTWAGGADDAAAVMDDPALAQFRVVLRPKDMDVVELEEVLGAIDRTAEGLKKSGAVDPTFQLLQAAGRQARDQFTLGNTPGGYSALKGRHHEELEGLERTLEHAGLDPSKPVEWGAMRSSQQQGFNNRVANFGQAEGGGAQERDVALLELAKRAGVLEELKLIAGTRAALGIANGSGLSNMRVAIGPSQAPSIYASGREALALRMDAVAKKLRGAGAAGAAGGAAMNAQSDESAPQTKLLFQMLEAIERSRGAGNERMSPDEIKALQKALSEPPKEPPPEQEIDE